MENIHHLLRKLKDSIKSNCKDSSLAAELEGSIVDLLINENCLENYTRLMLSIYDLSNNHSLIVTKQSNIQKTSSSTSILAHQLNLRLKVISMKMICALIDFISSQNNSGSILAQHLDIKKKAFQIMVKSIRLCLDTPEVQYNNFPLLSSTQSYCNMLWETVNDHRIPSQIVLLFTINKMDLMRISVDSQNFNIRQFIYQLGYWESICKGFQNDCQDKNQHSPNNLKKIHKNRQLLKNSEQYVSFIVAEVGLKLLRKGEYISEIINQLIDYLPQNYKSAIQSIISGQNNIDINLAPIFGRQYQLYSQIMNQGMENISEQYLQQIIEEIYESSNDSIFDLIVLTEQPIILTVWFSVANRKVSKPSNLFRSYECYFALVEKYLSQTFEEPINSDQRIRKVLKQEHLINLSRQICLNILRENKQTSLPVSDLVNYICKLLIKMVEKLCQHTKIISELFQSIYLVLSKYNIVEIMKTITALQLYFQMIHQISRDETYKKFQKYNAYEKTEMTVLLRASYEILKGEVHRIEDHTLQILRKKPQFGLLLLQQSEKIILVLDLDISQFRKIGNCFQIYLQMFREFSKKCDKNIKIAEHFEKYLLTSNFKELQLNLDTIHDLKQIIARQIQSEQQIFSLIWLYLQCFLSDPERIKKQQYGQAFNKFSKLLKMLNFVHISKGIVQAMKFYICQSCLKFKKSVSDKIKKEIQAGQIMFVNILYDRIMSYAKQDASVNQKQIEFVQFSMFELYCINSRQAQLEEFFQQNTDQKLQKLCLSSAYMPKTLRRTILRRFFIASLGDKQSQNVCPCITLEDMKELIQLSDKIEQTKLYISAAIDIFGQNAKKYLQILAEQNQKISEVLLSIGDEIKY